MIYKTFNIPIFDFELHVILDVSNTELDKLREILEDFDAPEDEIHYYIEEFENGSMDGGWFIWNMAKRAGVILLLNHTTLEDKLTTLMHEKRHAEDRILQLYNIKDHETAGLLAGYLGRILLTKVL
jgi:hypothetical protein